MAIDINLNIYEPNRSRVKLVHLYFGQTLIGRGSQFGWVNSVGMYVDGPSAYEDGASRHGSSVTKKQLGSWIDNGYLSRFPNKKDSSKFLNEYPDSAIFNLWFVDWS